MSDEEIISGNLVANNEGIIILGLLYEGKYYVKEIVCMRGEKDGTYKNIDKGIVVSADIETEGTAH